ncbi:MAG TPA: 23S rRNA (uracil(1939)-C(5))-methyltransferase RlmD [Solirubrobacteraceae bacterium]|nr:23S rRNA (uracil(1939)-C(5))-methyltransferase RlmD [Solirubrobacteraceae bacterium]
MTGRPERGEQLELTVERIAFGGDGVARLNDGGYVVFVGGVVPGDRVSAVVTQRKRSYAHARLLEVLEPGPDRIPAVAEHPGAPWQVLPYERQLELKQQLVLEALERLGGLSDYAAEPIEPAVQQWRYRNKLEYSFGRDESGELVCGFHRPGSWEEIVAFEDCLLASEAGNAIRRRVLDWCRAQGLAAYDRRTGEGLLRNLVVREGRHTGELQVRLVTTETNPTRPELDQDDFVRAVPCQGLLWTRSEALGETTAVGETALLAGEPRLPEQLGGLRLRISPEAFLQTNTEMAERLYGVVGEFAALQGRERVYDLYCGIGTIALSLAPRAGEVWGLEIVQEAVADAIAGAAENEISGARFFAGDVRLALRELVERAGRPDVLVVDPPRAGLSQKVVRRIIEAAPRRIVYVSCNPSTLAPNARQLIDAGWRLVRVKPVDMFPQTPHIECVALLER